MAVLRALVIVALAGCGAPGPVVHPVASAPMLPALQATLTSGAPWSYATDAAGRLLVIDVWASWCKPCKYGLSRVARVAAADTVVLGLSIDEDDEAMRAFLADTGVTFPNARVPVATVQGAPLSIASLPATVVVDRQGRIRWSDQDMQEADYGTVDAVLAQLRRE